MKFRCVLVVLLICLVSQELRAENWPCWRGPSGDGITRETDIPTRWSSSENVLWKIKVGGIGHSSPIVWDDAIFVTACSLESESRRLLRVDRETGSVVWDRVISIAPIEQMHRDNTPASATPVTDGRAVFVVFAVHDSLLVSAIDFSGNEIWTKTAGSFKASHGFCTSLILDGEKLFLSGLQDGPDAFVACLDKNTGDLLWKVPRTKQIRSYSTPFLCRIRGTEAILLSGADQTIAYARDSGKTIWEISGPGSKTVSSIVASEQADMAYVCGGRDNMFLAIDLQNKNAASPDSPKVAWSSKKAIPYMNSPLLTQGRLHVLSDDGIHTCYDPKSGERLAQRRAVGAVRASMFANESHIYITEVSGKTTVIENKAEWNVVSENELGEQMVASPAVSNGDIVLRGTSNLYLIRSTK